MADIVLGDRHTFEFISTITNEPVEILDYDTLAVPNFMEKIKGKDITSKEMIMALLADNSVVLVSMETGKPYLWVDLDLSQLSEDDEIVDFKPSGSQAESFFTILTKKGKILIYQLTVVDGPQNLKKYQRHLQKYDYGPIT